MQYLSFSYLERGEQIPKVLAYRSIGGEEGPGRGGGGGRGANKNKVGQSLAK
jgi:hypothetical protein